MMGNSITLTKWEGSVSGSVAPNSTTTHLITNQIPAGKIAVISVVNPSSPPGEAINLTLLDSYGSEVFPRSGRWYSASRMGFFKITTPGQYTVSVSSTKASTWSYTLRVAVVNSIPSFQPTDFGGYTSTAESTYIISNAPEMLGENSHKGEWGYYLQRSTLNSRGTVYWEHWNQFSSAMTFGVLLWNKDSVPVTVSLYSRCMRAVAEQTGNTMKATCSDVWTDRFNVVKEADDSELQAGNPVTIPAYNPNNSQASTLWVTRYSVPTGLFNGILSLTLTKSDGSLYMGSKLFCDTYIMTPSYEHQIKPAITRLHLAADPSASEPLRGCGTGAQMYANINTPIAITPDNPYNFLITGDAVPLIQNGENMALTTYEKDGSKQICQYGKNYGVKYFFTFSGGMNSARNIKISVRVGKYTNPNTLANNSVIYLAGYLATSTNTLFSKQIFRDDNPSDDGYVDLGLTVPKNQSFTLHIVVSGMSCMPLEVCFRN